MTVVNLKDFVFFQEGPGVRKSQYTTNGIKLLNVGNIQNGRIQLSNTNTYISEDEANGKYKHFLVDEGDLIIASSGIKPDDFNKKVAFISKEHLPLCMNTSTIRFKSKDVKLLNLNYLKYFFMSNYFKSQVKFYVTGSAQLNFGPSHLNKMKLLLPTLTDQKLIVDHLEKIEQLKDKREQNIQRCDELIKSIFYDMFGDPVKNEKNWPKYKIEELCDTNSGGTPNRSKKEYYNGDIPWIKSGELNQGYIYSAEEYISKLGLDNSSAKLIPNNTVLLAMYGATAGKVGFLKITAATNQAICAISPKRDLNKIYLYFYLKTLEKQFINSSIGGGQPNISQKIIKRTDILVPPIDIQTKFGEKLQLIEKFKEKQVKSKEEIDNLFNCLMQKYFNGE